MFSDPSTLDATNPIGAYFGDLFIDNWNMNADNLMWQLNGSTAVPEPATVALSLFGVAALLIFRRRSGVPS